MAKEYVVDAPQALSEEKTYYVSYSDFSPATVSSATATHVPPSGDASTPTVAVSSPTVSVELGPLAVTGIHKLDVLASLSNGEKSLVRLIIPCHY